MAADIKNTDNGVTGDQKLGMIQVNVGNVSSLVTLDGSDSLHTIDIDTIDDKYDDKFDSPRYYTGDTAD